MVDNDGPRLRTAYQQARDAADEARAEWDQYLATVPLDQPRPIRASSVGDAQAALDKVAAAERAEATARDALFAFIRGADA